MSVSSTHTLGIKNWEGLSSSCGEFEMRSISGTCCEFVCEYVRSKESLHHIHIRLKDTASPTDRQRVGTALLDFTSCWFWGKHPAAVSWDYVTFLLLRRHLARYILLFKSKNRMGTLCFVTSVSFFHSLSCTLRATSCSLLCKRPHIIWPCWQFALGTKLRPCLWGCVLSVSQLDNLKGKVRVIRVIMWSIVLL